MKKIFKVFICIMMIFSCLQVNITAEEVVNEHQYQIYPIPQSIAYKEGNVRFASIINVVKEEGIDAATVNYVEEVLTSAGYTVNYVSSIDSSALTIALGINDSNGVVDEAFGDDMIQTTDLFTKEDAYCIDVSEDGIFIVGKDSDGVFRGVSTLKMMLSSIENHTLYNVHIEDYACMNVRGFIEGFYGIWNHEQRMSLQSFAKDIKMNTFVWASKSDPYHTSKWNETYPTEQIEQMKELVLHGEATKCYFVWSMHMGNFFSGLSLTNTTLYETRWNQLMNKLNQLYDAGVRRFDFLNDDFGSGSHADVVTVLNRINNEFIKPKGCEPMTYCPQGYNKAWQGNRAEFNELVNLDDDISLYWTGDDVNAPITQDTVNYVKQYTGQTPTFWLNYPVNEHAATGLFLGDITHYARDGVTGLNGIVSNPSKFGESNKVALFQLASLLWNNNNYSTYANEIWENSFQYIQPEVADAFLTLGRNIANCPKSSRVPAGFNESEYLKEALEDVLAKVKAGTTIKDDANTILLQDEFTNILTAIETFKADCENEVLVNELTPWLNSLKDVVSADKAILEAVIALQENDLSGAWGSFSKATSSLATWESYLRCPSDASDTNIARAGSKRLQPFAQKLITHVQTTLTPQLNPNYKGQTLKVVMGGVEQSIDANANKMIDKDDSTYGEYRTVQKVDDYLEMDLGKVSDIEYIRILQGKTDTDHDIFHKAVIELSDDGITYTPINDTVYENQYLIELNVEEKARFVRFRLTETGYNNKPDYWTFVREFQVNKEVVTGNRVYTNSEAYAYTPLVLDDGFIGLADMQEVTLNPDEYLGIKLENPAFLNEFSVDVSTTGLTYYRGLNTNKVSSIKNGDTSGVAFKYLFMKNNGDAPVTFDINEFMVEAISAEAHGTYYDSNLNNALKEGSWDNVFDGDYSTYAWSNEAQSVGDYITFDLGGNVAVENLSVVMGDGNPRMYNGVVEVSKDGKEWEVVASVTNDNSRFEVPYRYIEAEFESKVTRYVRLRFTGDSGYYFKLHELVINEGVDTANEVKTIYTQPAKGTPQYAADDDLGTLFQMDAQEDDYIFYNVFDNINLKTITILQDPNNISNAKVYVLTLQGDYIRVGTLDQSVTTIKLDEVLLVDSYIERIEILCGEGPIGIYEIYVERGSDISDDVGVYVEPIERNNGISTTLKNIALNKEVEVSGTSNGNKSSINDGDAATKWDSNTVSKNFDENPMDSAYMKVDFGENTFTAYSTSIEYFNKVYPTKYLIQVSVDGYVWQTVYEGSNDHNGPTHPTNTITFDKPVTARYMRVYFEELNNVAAGTGVGVEEWIINGTENSDLTIVEAEEVTFTCKEGEHRYIDTMTTIDVTLAKGEDTLETIIPIIYDVETISEPYGTFKLPYTIDSSLIVGEGVDLEATLTIEQNTNKDVLSHAIELAQEMIENEELFEPETYQAFYEVYMKAVSINNKEDATQEEVEQVVYDLHMAIQALQEAIRIPEKVENLVAEDTNYKTITLTWDASEGATAYDVYRKSYKEGATFELETTVEEPTYESVGVMTGKEYTFYVVAKNEAAEAEASEEVAMATTLKGTVTLGMEKVSTSKFHLIWNKVDGATRYIVYRKRNDDKMKKVLTLGGDVFEYTTAEMPNGEYEFQVKAGRYDSVNRVMTGASNKVNGSVEALKPTVTVTAGSKSAKISWKKMEGVTHYQVYRATSSTGKYTKLVTTKELSYTAKSLTKGKKYYFKVRGYKTYKSGTDIKYNVYTPYSSVKAVTAK